MTSKLVAVLGCAAVCVLGAAGCTGPERVDSLAVPVHAMSSSPATDGTDPTTETSTETTEPTMAPPEYAERSWTWEDGLDVLAEAPVGWTEIDRGPGWWDLHDPTEQVVLRVQALDGDAPADVAAAELQRLSPAQGFVLIDQRSLAGEVDGAWDTGYEIHYRYDRAGTPRLATLRYLGTADLTAGMVGLLTPTGQHAAALAVLDRATSTIRWAG